MHACMKKGRSLCMCILCNSQSIRYMQYDSTHVFLPPSSLTYFVYP